MTTSPPPPCARVRPRALEDIQYNSIVTDTATSSEDELPHVRTIAPGDVQSLVGVSLGRAQTRLTLAQTPAAEKQAAIDAQGGFFGGPQIQDDIDLPEDHPPSPPLPDERLPRPSTREETRTHTANARNTTVRLPSPWRAGPRRFMRTDESRSMLKDGFRRRASSGSPPVTSSLGEWREALMTSFHNFTSPFSTASHGHSSDSERKSRPPNRSKRSGSLFASLTSLTSSSSGTSPGPTRHRRVNTIANSPAEYQYPSSPLSQRPPTARALSSDHGAPIHPVSSTASMQSEGTIRAVSRVASHKSARSSLRRSASESSLHTYRTLSRAPSLGDDSRFAHVQGQVNSRMKAIRDSWQDSNMRLPMPSLPSLSDLSLNNLNRSNSQLWKSATGGPKRTSTTPIPSLPAYPLPPKAGSQLPRPSTRNNANDKTAQTHPQFAKALAELTGDVVVLGGYRGSILRSADPPHRQLWAPIKVGLNVRKVDLEVGFGPEGDEKAHEKVIADGMLAHIGPVDISRRLFKRLRASENARSGKLRVHDYGYDWRLEPTFLSNKLIAFLESLPCNKPGTPKEKRGAVVIAHSLGGLITRHAVNQRPDLFAGVVYAGVPQTCVNILGPFRNGDDVLLSSRVLTAQVNFSIRTSFALLPLDGRCFLNKETKEEYPVDFFDPQTWIDYRLSPCVARPLPSLAEAPPTGLAGIMNSMASVLPGRKNSIPTTKTKQHPFSSAIDGLANPPEMDMSAQTGSSAKAEAQGNIDTQGTDTLGIQMDGTTLTKPVLPSSPSEEPATSIATTVTISRETALTYLSWILASIKSFKKSLDFIPSHSSANLYPPTAVIYGKSTPTVYGAKVASREAIKHADAYDDLAFASGDGVVLAKAAMLPEGYQVVRGGLVSSERGHVTLLGDLEAVGRCLRAVVVARGKGVGCG